MSTPPPESSPSPTSPPPPPPSDTSSPPPTPPDAPPPSPTTPPPTPTTPPPTPTTPPPIPTPPATPTPSPPSPDAPPPTNTTPPPTTTPTTPPPTTTPTPTPPTPTRPTPPTPTPPTGGARSPPPRIRNGGGGSLSPPAPPTPSDNGGGGGLSTGVVVGVAVGGVLVLAILSLMCICCFKKKKKRRVDGHFDYYGPPPPKAGAYGGQMQQQHWQQSPPPPVDHVLNMPPKLTPPPGGAPKIPSPQPPPLAGPYISSSGGSGSNYSGGELVAPASPGMGFAFAKSSFSYDELAMATDGFSEGNLLGQGGFGYVHRGVLSNGKEVAIKQLKVGSGQGEREFQAEVEIISRVHHKHLVSLVGYCITGSERMLVYEFVPNNTLEFHLHGKGRPAMDWGSRLKIALGSAKGLAYLHEDCHPKIIHRDIKASNILMDFSFEAKVADFGLAKFSSELNTHVSTRVMGTFGYLAPEYAASGKLTDKSDVYSFGVVLLELITGRKPVDSNHSFNDDSLVDWARPVLTRALEENNFDALVDLRIRNEYNQNEMGRMVACAAACVRHSAKRRPRMSQVARALDGDVSLSDLNEGTKPGHSTIYGSYEGSDYDASQYNEDLQKFRKMALTSQEYSSTEYSGGGNTSEYGLNPSGSSSEGQTTRELTTREMEMAKMKKDSQGYSSGY